MGDEGVGIPFGLQVPSEPGHCLRFPTNAVCANHNLHVKNTLLRKFFSFLIISFLQFKLSISEPNCTAASIRVWLSASRQQLSSVLTSDK